jgi:hypothetical protein
MADKKASLLLKFITFKIIYIIIGLITSTKKDKIKAGKKIGEKLEIK